MYNVHIHAGPAELGVLFVGVQVRSQVLTEIKVNPALLEDLVLLRAPNFFRPSDGTTTYACGW